MLGTERFLEDCQDTAHQRLGLRQPVRVLQECGHVAEGNGVSRMVLPVSSFRPLDSQLRERHGNVEHARVE